ncbi:MAG TPA: hypothetical protein VHZ24_04885 [Pirellulales bacterium]|jgi:hypothetical protein|nr:hypothetical protein [Pirellulales bacterium]
MRAFFALAVALSVISVGFTGCKKEESGVKKTETVTTPGGKTEKTDETKVETSGDNKSK